MKNIATISITVLAVLAISALSTSEMDQAFATDYTPIFDNGKSLPLDWEKEGLPIVVNANDNITISTTIITSNLKPIINNGNIVITSTGVLIIDNDFTNNGKITLKENGRFVAIDSPNVKLTNNGIIIAYDLSKIPSVMGNGQFILEFFSSINELNQVFVDKNLADITYNPVTHNVVVTWDFGEKENRQSCHTKTDFDMFYLIDGGEKIGERFGFFGTDFSPIYKSKHIASNGAPYFKESEFLNDDKTIISCKGQFTFNINNFQILKDFSGLALFTSFYEKVNGNTKLINEISFNYSENVKLDVHPCSAENPKHYTDYYYDIHKAQKVVSNKTCKNSNISFIDRPISNGDVSFNGIHRVSYVPVDSIVSIDYPIANSKLLPIDEAKKKKSGGGGNEHLSRPTFGLNHNTFAQQVSDGFTFNEKSFNITDNFWTPFEEQKIIIGKTNTFTAKVFTNDKIMIQEFLFGIPLAGEAHNAELGIEVHYNYDGSIKEVKTAQKTNVIDPNTVHATSIKSKCLDDEKTERCLVTIVTMKFLEPLKDKVMAIKAIDIKRKVHITYLNDGFDISGDSLNPMLTKQIIGTEKYEGLITVTQSEKYSENWISNDGREFNISNNNNVIHTNQKIVRVIDTGSPDNRLHSGFAQYASAQSEKAELTLSQICSQCNDESFDKIDNTYSTGGNSGLIDPKRNAENIRAEQILKELYGIELVD